MNPLEVPPDLAQLQRDGRYQPQRGAISASAHAGRRHHRAHQRAADRAQRGGRRTASRRTSHRRWLSVPKPPEQVWPQIVSFWQDLGFTLVEERRRSRRDGNQLGREPRQAAAGHHPQVARLACSTRCIPPARWTSTAPASSARPTGSEVFVTHRGMIEVYTNPQKDFTKWEPRPSDPRSREPRCLARLLVKLGATEDGGPHCGRPARFSAAPAQAGRARVWPASPPPRSRSTTASTAPGGASASRSTARASRSKTATAPRGVYFVRYVDPKTAGQDATPGFFAKLFGASTDTSAAAVSTRCR